MSKRTFTRRLTGLASRAFLALTRRMPLTWTHATGAAMGALLYALAPRVRRVAWDNIDKAYGGSLTRAQKKRILWDSTQNLTRVAAEFAATGILDQTFLERHIEVRGVEHVDRSKGVVFVGAHLGNWEWMGPATVHLGFKTAAIIRPLDDPALNRAVDRIRTARGVRTIGKDGAAGSAIRLLREGYAVGILIDQSPRDNGVPVTFFGRPCWASGAPALLALRARVPVHAATMTRQPNGKYLLAFSPPIPLLSEGGLRENLVQNTQRLQDAIETAVRAEPGQWLWAHRRWKPRPKLEADWRRRDRNDEPPPPPQPT